MKKVSKTLTEQLARVTTGVERLNDSDSPRQIDIDLLLEDLRDLYDTVRHLSTEAPEEQPAAEEPATAPAPEPEVVASEPAVAEHVAFVAPLVVDTDEPAPYAPDEAVTAADTLAEQPSVEEVEGTDNDTIFATPDEEPETEIPQPASEPAPVEEPQAVVEKAAQNAPQTLWEKLQANHTENPLGEQMGSGRTLSEQLGDVARGAALGNVVANSTPSKPAEEAPAAPEPVAEPAPVEEQPHEEKPAQPSLFDYIHSSQASVERKAEAMPIGEAATVQTVADTLGSTRQGGGIERTMASKKVQDLRTIININDKFSFQNELFHYNMRAYNEFIMKLNAIDDRETALSYVGTIAEQYQWNSESLVVQTFYKIFDRKF